METGIVGNRDARYAFTANSCSGFKYENEEANCNGDILSGRFLDAILDAVCETFHLCRTECNVHAPAGVNALLNAQAVIALDQRRGLLPLERVMMAPVHALNEQHILKSRRGDEDHPGTLALKESVETKSSSQHDRGGLFDLSLDSRMTPTTDLMESLGEEGNLPMTRSPVASSTPIRSVKVPPVSIPHLMLG